MVAVYWPEEPIAREFLSRDSASFGDLKYFRAQEFARRSESESEFLPGSGVVTAEGGEPAQVLIVMKIEITGHDRGLGDGSAGEIIRGRPAAAFESESGLRGVNRAVEGAIAREIERRVCGQP